MKYRLVERGNPGNVQAPKKWYAVPVQSGKTITIDEISKEISGRSSLTRGDVSSVLQNLVDELPLFLLMGRSVQLGDFGTLRVSFSSDGVDDPKDFHSKMVRSVKIIFTPGKTFKKEIESISFEVEK